jgi:endonuclease YncB( thermonuclease family)
LPPEILMHSIGLDKYGRSLAIIWASDGSSWDEINAMLVEQGHAAPA